MTSSGCPCSIWAPSARPAKEAENDHAAVEVGTRFRSDVDGLITGIRFYKGATNTGTHVGHLWTNTGQLLATATFTSETAQRLAGGLALRARRDHRRHDLRRVLPRAARQLRGDRPAVPLRRRRQRAAARAAQRRRRRQRRLRLRRERHVPERRLPLRGLLGRRGLRDRAAARTRRPPTITGRLPAPDAAGVAPTADRQRVVQRADGRREHHDGDRAAARPRRQPRARRGDLRRRRPARRRSTRTASSPARRATP